MQEAQGWSEEEDLPDGLYDEFFENQDDDAPDYEHQLQEMQIDNIDYDPNYVDLGDKNPHNYFYQLPKIPKDASEIRRDMYDRRRYLYNLRRYQQTKIRKQKTFADFAATLKKDINYSVTFLTQKYNKFFELKQPLTTAGFGKLNEVRQYFTKERLQKNHCRMTTYKLK